MGHTRALTCAGLLAVLAAAPTAAPAAGPSACRTPPGSSVAAHSAEVLVVVGRPTGPESTPASVVACDRRTGRRTRLVTPAFLARGDTFAGQFVVAGRYVGYVLGRLPESSQSPDGYAGVRLVDARTGRPRRLGPTASTGAITVSALRVDPSGRAAWIARVATGREVHAYDAGGPHRLAVDRDADDNLLTLTRGVLGWTEGGQRVSRALR